MHRSVATTGFTLVEVLLAIVLLTIAIVSIAELFAAATATNTTARTITIASLLAAEKVEQFRARPLDEPAFAPSAVDTLQADVDGYWDEPVAGYTRRWSIAPLPSYPADGVVLHVVVGRSGRAPVAALVTIRVRKGR